MLQHKYIIPTFVQSKCYNNCASKYDVKYYSNRKQQGSHSSG